jgi:hypothetical protein
MRLSCYVALASSLFPLATPAFTAPAKPIGQETVEVRPPRSPQARPKAHDHQHGNAGHEHGVSSRRHTPIRDGSGHSHGLNHGHDHQHGFESENLFGFTLGSDTERVGVTGIALETVGRFGKRDGSYSGVGKKLELSHGVTGDLSVALGLLTDYHRVTGVTGFDDVRVFDFNGVGGELRWRLARRGPNPVGVTLHLEPSVARYDELTGQRAIKYGAENKLIFDTELVKDRIFAAFNLLYEVERVRERGSLEWENSSKIGIAAAATVQVAPQAFLGAEVRYLRAYEGLMPQIFAGDATFAGPTFFWHFAKNAWIAAAWNVQVAGHEAGNEARLDLTNFERHHARLKIGVEFESTATSQIRRR